MSSYQNQATRVTVESTKYEKGQLLATVTGMKGERFEDLPLPQPHGFHARPKKGAVGHLVFPGGRRDQAFIQLASDPKKVPELGEGEAAMYDAGGNVVKLTASGWEFNMDVVINGNVTISGNVQVGGNLNADGVITDSDGNNGA
jgi:phage gp45-like